LCHGEVVEVQKFNSGEIVAQSSVANETTNHCCFSPDGKLIAAAAGMALPMFGMSLAQIVASLKPWLATLVISMPLHSLPPPP
jgi:hypothetical protein